MGTQPDERTPPEWVESVKARGLGHALSIALDVFEPLGLFGAQLLYTAQPVLGVFVRRSTLEEIAGLMEQPGGIEQLRQYLEE